MSAGSNIRYRYYFFIPVFVNIRGYQMLSVSVTVGTDSYLNPCLTGFLTAAHR
jgi:hypothetical protein